MMVEAVEALQHNVDTVNEGTWTSYGENGDGSD